MPRSSEKAQLVRQLQDMWLACVLFNTVFDDPDLLQQILSLGPTHSRSDIRGHDWPYSHGSRGLLKGGGEEWLGGVNPEMGLRIEETAEDEEEETEEVMGILGVIISQIRYLAPRMPIPHSEYLFTYHVSKFYLLVSFLNSNQARKGTMLT